MLFHSRLTNGVSAAYCGCVLRRRYSQRCGLLKLAPDERLPWWAAIAARDVGSYIQIPMAQNDWRREGIHSSLRGMFNGMFYGSGCVLNAWVRLRASWVAWRGVSWLIAGACWGVGSKGVLGDVVGLLWCCLQCHCEVQCITRQLYE